MKVEAFRCHNDKTWDTEVIEIEGSRYDFYFLATDTPDTGAIEDRIREHYQAATGIEFCGLYYIPEEEEEIE